MHIVNTSRLHTQAYMDDRKNDLMRWQHPSMWRTNVDPRRREFKQRPV